MSCIAPSTTWIQYQRPKPQARIRLFCFPYAGGGASIFRSFAASTPPEIEVWPVQLPGRENRLAEKPFSRLDDLIEALKPALLPYLDMPYAFFGHSMGALICFELTRALRRNGHLPGPVRLLVSGHRAPQLPALRSPIHHVSDLQFVEELRHFNGTPEAVLQHAELLQLLLPLLRADFALCETYAYTQEQLLTCPISAFGGLQDEDVPHSSLQAWCEQTSGAFKVRFFAGDHFFLYPEQANLLAALSQDLLNDL